MEEEELNILIICNTAIASINTNTQLFPLYQYLTSSDIAYHFNNPCNPVLPSIPVFQNANSLKIINISPSQYSKHPFLENFGA